MIRAAIIGAGGVAGQHVSGLTRLPDVKLVAVCDIDVERAKKMAEAHGAKAYQSYETMLAEVQPDIVHVCTPEAAHFEPVMASLEAGAHVFCEKIMAETVVKARAMVSKALQAGRTLAVDYNYRFMPVFAELKKLIEQGELGRIALFNVYAHSYCMHHAIDLLRFLNGEVVEVAAMYTRWERAEGALRLPVGDLVYCPTRNEGIMLRFANGAVATLAGSIHVDLKENMVQLECVGEKGRAKIDNVQIEDISGRLRVYPQDREIPTCTEEERRQGFGLAFQRSIEAFVASVREQRPASPSGFDGLRVVEIEEAIVRSQQQRRFIPLPRIACGSLAFSKLPLEEALVAIARLGIGYVDVAVQEGWAHLNPSAIADDVEGAIKRLRGALRAANIIPVSFNVGLGSGEPAEETRRMAAVAKLAQAVGVQMATLSASPKGTAVGHEVERGKRLVEAARPYGVVVTIETHFGATTEDPVAASEIVGQAPGLGLTLDPSHYYAGPTQGRGFDAVFEHVKHVHLRDGGAAWEKIQMPAGQGVVDFAMIFSQLARHGYNGDYVIEYIDSIGSLDTQREVLAMKRMGERILDDSGAG